MRVTSATVHGERYIGPVVRVMGIIGQQQCVRECRHRPKLCRGVNYRKQELLCELVSVINETEPKSDYVRIELDQVFQRRQDGSEDFYRTWIEYKNGFGNLSSEFWLGNDKLHQLLSQGTYEMRMNMEDFDNETRYVKYSSFNVGNESTKFTFTVSGFSGNVGSNDLFNVGVTYRKWRNAYYSLKSTELMVRRVK
uniref:Ficolin-1 n=1 Tax=Magallana gigas TaxID=29159 RepID=K1Q0F5_MAGGI